MTGKTLEGTSDEISEHAESLSGPRLRPEALGRFAGLLRPDDLIRYSREGMPLEVRRR